MFHLGSYFYNRLIEEENVFRQMIKIFEYLYYCQYRMFALVKRIGEKDENLASLFYSLLLLETSYMKFEDFLSEYNKEISSKSFKNNLKKYSGILNQDFKKYFFMDSLQNK